MRPPYRNKIIFITVVLSLLTLAFFWGDDSGTSGQAGRVQAPQTLDDRNANPMTAGKNQSAAPQKTVETPVAEATEQAQPTAGRDLTPAAGAGSDAAALVNTCTLAVNCITILDKMDKFDRRKLPVLPPDGIIFPAAEVSFAEGESAFEVLQREMKKAGIHLEFNSVPLYKSNYIEGIGNLYELDGGELSGWVYRINGAVPGYGCNLYQLQPGDVVEFVYTCNLGRDVGGNNFSGE